MAKGIRDRHRRTWSSLALVLGGRSYTWRVARTLSRRGRVGEAALLPR